MLKKGDLVSKVFERTKQLTIWQPAPKGAAGVFIKVLDSNHNLFGEDNLAIVLFQGRPSPELVMLSNLKKLTNDNP